VGDGLAGVLHPEHQRSDMGLTIHYELTTSTGDEAHAYVNNCQLPFNLSANAILRLKEAGVTTPVILAMLTHDSSLRNQNPPAP
jgi:hypothetical protein